MEGDSVPIISLKGFFSDDPIARQQVIDEVRNACLRCGFFMIQDHQADEEIIDKAWKVSIFLYARYENNINEAMNLF